MQQQPPQQAVEHGREPCPDRILDDIGGAFGMGALGGGLWHTYRGLKNSPKGYKIVGTLDVRFVRFSCGPTSMWRISGVVLPVLRPPTSVSVPVLRCTTMCALNCCITTADNSP